MAGMTVHCMISKAYYSKFHEGIYIQQIKCLWEGRMFLHVLLLMHIF
jgi:hypothetical protein